MKIEHLREFLTLAEILSFSAAAEQLSMSQPVLSTHIKSIERELGFSLFDRTRQSVSLSKMGAAILPEIREAVNHYDRALALAAQGGVQRSSAISIGYLYNAFRAMLPPIARRFSNENPETELVMRSFGYKDVTDALLGDVIDIAFTIDVDRSLHKTCNMLMIREDPICCVVRRDDPLAAYDEVSLYDLQDESFILPHAEYSGAFARYHDAIFLRAGFKPHVSVLYQDSDTRNLAVEAGEGVGLIGRHFQPYLSSHLKFIRIAEPYCKYDLVALWKKSNQNTGVVKLVKLIDEELHLTGF